MNAKQAKRLRKSIKDWNHVVYKDSTHEKEKPHQKLYRTKDGKFVPMKVSTSVLSPTCGRFVYKAMKKAYS